MAHQEKRYCRGCKCTTDASLFNSNGKEYKQCNRCRGRIHDRKRTDATIVCDCGRKVLMTSLRDHLRTMYHGKCLKEKARVHKAQDIPRKVIPPAASHQPKSASASVAVSQSKPGSASAPMTKVAPKGSSSFVFRKATVAPVNIESLRAKLKEVQTTPAL
jgi:hypothetical protein